jgi:abhydrolase domain-containing protein 17
MNDRVKRLLFGKFSIKRMIHSIILISIIVYSFLFLFALFYSDRLIFQPQVSSYKDTDEIIKLSSKDGVKISALYLPNSKATFTILYSHGNAEDLGDLLPILRAIRDTGFSIFAYDYQGYGTSQGMPSESNTYADIDAAYDYLINNLKISPGKIISFGHSVGGGPAIDLAVRRPVAGLIVECSFTTAFRVLTRITLFPFDRFNNIKKIREVRCPVLIIHGKEDQVIPSFHGERLFEAANEPKHLLLIDNADHNNILWKAGDLYSKTLSDFALLIKQNQLKVKP